MKKTTKHTVKTKLPWFSRLLRLSARKRGGLILQRPRYSREHRSSMNTYNHVSATSPHKLSSEMMQLLIRGYHTAVFTSTRISRSSVDYQPEAIAEG